MPAIVTGRVRVASWEANAPWSGCAPPDSAARTDAEM